MEKEKLQAAKNLEFEKATELRGQLKKLRESVPISPL
ncbi:MAG: UvrB/UvrC motif-containing protein [Gallionella sp.]|nr:UvrB/UvrC motif-containing protein [Gallionella sp.]